MYDLSFYQLIIIAIIFIWTSFVRTGIGFGGAALSLPFLLLFNQSALYWLPIIGIHLLFFTSLALRSSLKKVDWSYLKQAILWMFVPFFIGIFGIISLPDLYISIFIYSITIFYSILWLFDKTINSNNNNIDKFLLIIGAYIAGTSLIGAPLLVSVFMRNVAANFLRNTLFVLWFILVSIKMSTFIIVGVIIDWKFSLILIPIAAIGHLLGLKLHNSIMQNYQIFKKIIAITLITISLFSLVKIIQLYL